MRVPTPPPPPHLVTPGGIAVSDSEKAETFADSLETQSQPVIDPSVPAVIEMVDVALRSYFLTPAREPQLTTSNEVHEFISECFQTPIVSLDVMNFSGLAWLFKLVLHKHTHPIIGMLGHLLVKNYNEWE